MKWHNYLMAVVGVSVVVMACIVLPPYIAKQQDLKWAETAVISTEQEIQVFKKNRLDTISKLSLVMDADKSTSNITVQMELVDSSVPNYSQSRSTVIRDDEVVSTSIRELKKLQEAGLVPQFDITEQPDMSSYSLYIYTDANTPSVYVLEWKVFLSYPGFSVNLTLEDESAVIYGFIVDMETITNLDMSSAPKKWAEYLGLSLTDCVDAEKGVMGEYCENDTVTWFHFKQITHPDAISILPIEPMIVIRN